MNVSSANVTLVLESRDSFTSAVTKNVIVVVLGITINYISGGLIHSYHKHQVFYTNPRYILFVHLLVNDMIHVMLTIFLFVISYALYQINASFCSILVFPTLMTTMNTPLNLACMAIECYVAVCMPLRHTQICTVRRTYLLIGLIWIIALVISLPDLLITVATQPQDFFYSKIFCVREIVLPHPFLNTKRDVIYSVFLIVVGLTIFYTYFKILFTAKTANRDTKKARNTILLHGFQLLLCMMTYIAPQLKDTLRKWFPKDSIDSRFATYIIIQILPRSISPIIYGVRDNTLRKYLKRYLLC